MGTTARKEDRRVKRTKKLLTQALTKLMTQKQLKEITVKELAELADMNRGTFYLYYRDIYDMLEKTESSLFNSLDAILTEHSSSNAYTDIKQVLEDVFEFISENREMCQVLLSENGDISFLHRLNGLVREKCRAFWPSDHLNIESNDYEYSYSFRVFGCAGLIRAWLINECAEPSTYMAKLAENLLLRGLSND